jgi:hypothetical protein
VNKILKNAFPFVVIAFQNVGRYKLKLASIYGIKLENL